MGYSPENIVVSVLTGIECAQQSLMKKVIRAMRILFDAITE